MTIGSKSVPGKMDMIPTTIIFYPPQQIIKHYYDLFKKYGRIVLNQQIYGCYIFYDFIYTRQKYWARTTDSNALQNRTWKVIP